MTSAEEWRPVVGHEDSYEVSSLGLVRSLDRVILANREDSVRRRPLRGRILKSFLSPTTGYRLVSIGRDNQQAVHTLVLNSFVGPCPPGHECLHFNNDRSDASLGNLRWGTPSENQMDSIRHGTKVRGEASAKAKLTEAGVRTIRASTKNAVKLAAELGISPTLVKSVRRGERWAHVPNEAPQ